MTNILVTGATGFIGGRLVELLSPNKSLRITASGRSRTGRFDSYPNVSFIPFDLCQKLPELRFEICIHCAGLASDRGSKKELFSNNEIATKNLLSSLKACRTFIYISSASVYDFSNGKSKDENDAEPDSSISAYGRSKLMTEQIVKSSLISSKYIFRPRAVYGHGDRTLLPRILKMIRFDKMIVPKNLSSEASLTHIDNLMEVVLHAVRKAQSGCHIYNVADLKSYNLVDILKTILYIKKGHTDLYELPDWISKIMISTGIFTRQSLNYLKHNSVLKLDRIKKDLKYKGHYNFYTNLESL